MWKIKKLFKVVKGIEKHPLKIDLIYKNKNLVHLNGVFFFVVNWLVEVDILKNH